LFNKYEVPKDGLPNNEALLKMLSVKLIRVLRGKACDLLEKSLNDIQKKYNYIKRILNIRILKTLLILLTNIVWT